MKCKKIPSEIFDIPFLTDNFKLKKKDFLASGGFSNVYRGKILKSGKNCAIKITWFGSENGEGVDKAHEIEVIEKLGSHGHVIKYIGYFPDPEKQKKFDFNIIAMELAENNLNSMLYPDGIDNKNVRLQKPLLIQMLMDVISGLKFAHSKGIAHSDIKPGNILLFKSPRTEKSQREWVYDDQIIFKLCDWGISRIAKQSVDNTMTLKSHEQTQAFAPPEMISKSRLINLQCVDIYSLGLVVLNCCGIPFREFISLNFKSEDKEHKFEVNKLLKKYKLEQNENYGEEFCKILSKMITFDHSKRPSPKDLIESLKCIIKKMKKEINTCFFCSDEHSRKESIELKCKHWFGSECFDVYLEEQFKENPVYEPICPVISCSKRIQRCEIEELIENKECEELAEYFGNCKNPNCRKHQLFTYKLFLPKMKCNHRFCSECISSALADKKLCWVKKCQEKISSKIFDKIIDSCYICKKEVDYFTLTCCKLQLCYDCFKKHFLNDFEECQINPEKRIHCKKCDQDHSEGELSKILKPKDYKIYKEMICRECRKFYKFTEKIPKCGHSICKDCILTRLDVEKDDDINIECPGKNCKREIPQEIISKYQEILKKLQLETISQGKNTVKIDEEAKNEEPKPNEEVKNEDAFLDKTIPKEQTILKLDNGISTSFRSFCNECKKPYSENEMIQFFCQQHMFCKNCLERVFQNRLANPNFCDQASLLLKCLVQGCLKTIKLDQNLETFLPKEIFTKLEVTVKKERQKIPGQTEICESCKKDMEKNRVKVTQCCKKLCCVDCLNKIYTEGRQKVNWDPEMFECPLCQKQITYWFIGKTADPKLFQEMEKELMERIKKQDEELLKQTPEGDNLK